MGRPRQERVGYAGVHYRLVIDRGKASGYDCVDCGGPARDWSYRGGAPDEIVTASGQVYSLDQNYYDPRCAICHKRHDEVALKLPQNRKGYPWSVEERERRRRDLIDYALPAAAVAPMSEADWIHIRQLAEINRGNTHTLGRQMPEHEKRHRSEANKGRPKTAEHKEKLRQAALKRWARQRGEEL